MPLESLVKIVTKSTQEAPTLVVFDLDSTIFDVSPRTEEILKSIANDPEFASRHPDQALALKSIVVKSTDWGIKEALSRAKITGTIDFFEEIHKQWSKLFFSNDFLHFDKPYEGVIKYIKYLEKLGARIMYLTGRDSHRMGKGSREVLLMHELPVDDSHHQLILKPQKGMSDSKFKRDIFIDLIKNHDDIWFFENEPANVNLIIKEIPEVQIIFVDSVHSKREEKPDEILSIGMNFNYKEK